MSSCNPAQVYEMFWWSWNGYSCIAGLHSFKKLWIHMEFLIGKFFTNMETYF